jgi:hypothetical protein
MLIVDRAIRRFIEPKLMVCDDECTVGQFARFPGSADLPDPEITKNCNRANSVLNPFLPCFQVITNVKTLRSSCFTANESIRSMIGSGGERVWRFADFDGLPPAAVAQTLSRLAR